MRWDPILNVDELFETVHKETLILVTTAGDEISLQDFKIIHDNNHGARIEFTSGVREIITKEHIEAAKEVAEKITKIMKQIEHECGGELIGLEYKLKSEKSLNRKLRDFEDHSSSGKISSKTLKLASKGTHDILRFTILFKPENLVEGFFEAEKILKKNKMKFVRVKNTFGVKDNYKGVNTYVLASGEKNDYVFELQFHTRESWQAKEESHEYYEIERDSSSSKEQQKEARNKQVEIFRKVGTPDHFNLIKEIDTLSEYEAGID